MSGGIPRDKRIISPKDAAAFCAKHQVSRLSVFGSFLRTDFSPESDMDLLVEFQPGATVGLLDVAAMELELTTLIGHRVDLRTIAELSPHFRSQVLAAAETVCVHR